MKFTNKDRRVKIECATDDTRLMQYMRDELMDELHKEWYEFVQEVAVAIRKSQPGDRLRLESKPIVVEIKHDISVESITFPEGQ